MTDLDTALRRELRAATDHIGLLTPLELEQLLAEHGTRNVETLRVETLSVEIVDDHPRLDIARHGSGRRRLAAAAAITLLVASAGIGTIATTKANEGQLITASDAPQSDDSGAFADWAQGWHELAPPGLPVGTSHSIAWLDGHLYVAMSYGPASDLSAPQPTIFWRFDPASQHWLKLPSIPFDVADIVATDDSIVAVGGPREFNISAIQRRVSWATWQMPTELDTLGAWTTHGAVPVAPELRSVPTTGPTRPDGARPLLWTGDRVLDLTFGAVLDPQNGTASALEMPANVVSYSDLLVSNPVWTGTRAVAVSWSSSPGLSWDRFGKLLGEVPGPVSASVNENTIATAAVLNGDVVLIPVDAPTGEATGAVLDSANNWSGLAALPRSAQYPCSYTNASLSTAVVIGVCDRTDEAAGRSLLGWNGSGWAQLPTPPGPVRGMQRWAAADDALVMWVANSDTANDLDAPYQWAGVWVPE